MAWIAERAHRAIIAIVTPPADAPLRRITGFHIDDEGHWVAELECGHGQHMRHQPPWQVRPWVLTPEGRQRFIGTPIACVRCRDDDG